MKLVKTAIDRATYQGAAHRGADARPKTFLGKGECHVEQQPDRSIDT